MGYQHIDLETDGQVGWLWLNRPAKHNALSADMWADIPDAVAELGGDETLRCIVVAGRGPSFTVGIDLAMLGSFLADDPSHAGRSKRVRSEILRLQQTMSAFEQAPMPVIAAVHGWCLGAGIDLITACDIRLASRDATFGIRETPMGLVADVGTVQRLPRIVGPGHTAELLYTGRDFDSSEAARVGLVNRVVDDVHAHAAQVAAEVAANSPLVVQGAKEVLRLQGHMSTEAALDHMALWNAAFLASNDLTEAMAAFVDKRPPDFTGT
ncbi:MAG TPA: enoyl-CoA hydratase-related protein [Acidimicrobiia bacterium]|nr:enoyl-CoA hydratase-related protein [Acidimicrobiia bacterium]